MNDTDRIYLRDAGDVGAVQHSALSVVAGVPVR